MKIRRISIVILCIITVVTLIMPIGVNAAETLDLFQFEKIYTDGNICTIEYFAPKNSDYIHVIIIGNRSVSYGQNDRWQLIFYEAGTVFEYDTGTKAWKADKEFIYKTYSSYETAIRILFEGQETEEFSKGKTFANFTYGDVYLYQETAYASEAAQSLEVAYYDWYVETNGTEPTFKENVGGSGDDKEYKDGVLGWFQRLFDKLAEIVDLLTLKDLASGDELLHKTQQAINDKLLENKFYTSVTSIKDTLTELFNADYSDRNGFYELGLTNITLGRTENKIYKDFGNDTIGSWEQEYIESTGKIDYGLDNVKVLNLDWYFGEDLADGYYRKGMKPYIDTFISAFLWLMYGWALYLNLPNWISGEMTRIANLSTSSYSEHKERKYSKTINESTKGKEGKKE